MSHPSPTGADGGGPTADLMQDDGVSMFAQRSEERFDRIVRLAARLLDVPVVLINLVSDRQYTKASHGLDPGALDLADSFCRHTVARGDLLEVPDLAEDDRFATSRFVTGEAGLRFYAGEPLTVAGHDLGTLCVLDTRPRTLTEDQRAVLDELASWAEAELNNTALNDLVFAAEERERLLRRILEAVHDAVIGSTGDGSILFVNPAATRLLGWTEEEMAGRQLHALAHHSRPDGSPYPAAECPGHLAITRAEVVTPREDVFWRKDGTPLTVELSVAPMVLGDEDRGAVITLRDVSERTEVERLKAEFIGVVSHELRTPLTSIKGSLRLLESGVMGPVTAAQLPLVTMAVQNANRLTALVDDILDLERLDAGRMPLRPECIDASALAVEVVEALAPAARVAEVELTTETADEPLPVHVDPRRMSQALTNLVGNAMKFSPPGGRVTVRSRRDGAEVRLEVHDDGPGLPPEELEKVFQRFHQAPTTAGERKGTGLGLSITRAIVERSAGRVEVSSVLGEGSVFSIVVPLVGVGAGST